MFSTSFIKKVVKIALWIGWGSVLAAYIMKAIGSAAGGQMLISGLGTISWAYLATGVYIKKSDLSKIEMPAPLRISMIICWLALTIFIIAVLFDIMRWPNGSMMLTVGLVVSSATALHQLFYLNKEEITGEIRSGIKHYLIQFAGSLAIYFISSLV